MLGTLLEQGASPAADIVELIGGDCDDEAVDEDARPDFKHEKPLPEANSRRAAGGRLRERPHAQPSEPERIRAQPKHGMEEADSCGGRPRDGEHGHVAELNDEAAVVEHRIVRLLARLSKHVLEPIALPACRRAGAPVAQPRGAPTRHHR